MRRDDRLALGGYLLAAASTMALAEWLQRRGVPSRLTRKLVHVVAGLSPLYVMATATSKEAALLPYLATTGMNAALWRWDLLPSLRDGSRSPGVLYFPIVQALLLALLWRPGASGRRSRAARAALLALALGDAAAALVGQRWGRHRYRVGNSERSVEGSGAMFAVTLVTTLLALRDRDTGRAALPRAAAVAGGATLLEAISPAGTDNLTVPLGVASALLALPDETSKAGG